MAGLIMSKDALFGKLLGEKGVKSGQMETKGNI